MFVAPRVSWTKVSHQHLPWPRVHAANMMQDGCEQCRCQRIEGQFRDGLRRPDVFFGNTVKKTWEKNEEMMKPGGKWRFPLVLHARKLGILPNIGLVEFHVFAPKVREREAPRAQQVTLSAFLRSGSLPSV